jgi:hypothetical protein
MPLPQQEVGTQILGGSRMVGGLQADNHFPDEVLILKGQTII